jgi:hypothetical protein
MSYLDLIPNDIINIIIIKLNLDELVPFFSAFFNIYQNVNYNNLVYLKYGKYTNEILTDFESKKLSYEDYYIIVKTFVLKKLFKLNQKIKDIYMSSMFESKYQNDVYSMITLMYENKEIHIFKIGNISTNDESKLLNLSRLSLDKMPETILSNPFRNISSDVPNYEYYDNRLRAIISKEKEKELKIPYSPNFRKLVLYFQLDSDLYFDAESVYYTRAEPARVEYIFMNPIRPIDILDKINEFYLEKESQIEINNSIIDAQKKPHEHKTIDINRKPRPRYEMLGNMYTFTDYSFYTYKDGFKIKFDQNMSSRRNRVIVAQKKL